MQLAVNQTVLLKHTRERARVVQELENGQWLIEAAMDGERFPVHEDDIDPQVGTGQRLAVKQTQRTEIGAPDLKLYPDETGPQVQIAFLPVGELDFDGVLLNFSHETLVFSARLLSNRGQQWNKTGLLGPTSGIQLGHLYRDLLNESAQVEVQASRKAEMGTDSKQEKTIKLKPKLFYKNTREVSWYHEEIAVFDVFAKASLERKPVATLADYTKQHAPPVKPPEARKPKVNPYGVIAAAEFPTELDLHIDKLVGDASELTGTEMLDLQLQHVRDYLDVAIRLGVDRVYLIHGKGKGALRNRIHEQLAKLGDIEGFKNEFHPKYGTGATEVVLR